jgi:Zn-dependent hydrolases, including glyoxylases
MVHIEKLTLGVLQANCYLVQCIATRQTAVIDPGLEPERILERLHALSDPPVAAILATHGHFDHVVGVRAIKAHTGAPFWISREEWELWAQYAHTHPVYLNLPPTEPVPPPDRFLTEGETVCIGALEFETLALRGHAPDHLGFLLKPRARCACSVATRFSQQYRAHRHPLRRPCYLARTPAHARDEPPR